MRFFQRSSHSPPQRNLAALLAEWGRARFEGIDVAARMSEEAQQYRDEILNMGHHHQDKAFPARRQAAISEIREAGLREGGWAVYGAWEAVDMMHAQFAFLEPPEDVMQELLEARVKFLHELNPPDLAMHLNSYDSIAFRRLFPERHAVLFPGWGE